jgi:hypothetical protein
MKLVSTWVGALSNEERRKKENYYSSLITSIESALGDCHEGKFSDISYKISKDTYLENGWTITEMQINTIERNKLALFTKVLRSQLLEKVANNRWYLTEDINILVQVIVWESQTLLRITINNASIANHIDRSSDTPIISKGIEPLETLVYNLFNDAQ